MVALEEQGTESMLVVEVPEVFRVLLPQRALELLVQQVPMALSSTT